MDREEERRREGTGKSFSTPASTNKEILILLRTNT